MRSKIVWLSLSGGALLHLNPSQCISPHLSASPLCSYPWCIHEPSRLRARIGLTSQVVGCDWCYSCGGFSAQGLANIISSCFLLVERVNDAATTCWNASTCEYEYIALSTSFVTRLRGAFGRVWIMLMWDCPSRMFSSRIRQMINLIHMPNPF